MKQPMNCVTSGKFNKLVPLTQIKNVTQIKVQNKDLFLPNCFINDHYCQFPFNLVSVSEDDISGLDELPDWSG